MYVLRIVHQKLTQSMKLLWISQNSSWYEASLDIAFLGTYGIL